MTPKAPSRVMVFGAPAALLVLIALPWLFCSAPWEPDESRYLEIAREMADGGSWLIPTLNGVPYLEKPPLYIWSIAALFKILGPSILLGRLVSLLSGVGSVLVVCGIAASAGGRRLALRAGLILSTSPLFLVLSTVVTIDMLLCFWVTAAIGAFAHGTSERVPPSTRRTLVLLGGYAALALAVLTKGPVALAVPGLVWIFWRPMGSRRILPPAFWVGSCLMVGLAAPWFLMVQREIPAFWDFFFWRGHLGRVAGADVDNINFHGEPWHYYLPILAGGAAPWIFFLCAPVKNWRAELGPGAWPRLGWSWILPALAFFSGVAGKLPTYVLPLLPAIALLVALRWEEAEPRRRWFFWITVSAAVASLAGVIALSILRWQDVEIWWGETLDWSLAYTVTGGFIACEGLAAGLLWRGKVGAAFRCLLVGSAFLLSAAGALKAPVDRAISVEGFTQSVRAVFKPGDDMVCVNKYFPLFAFTLGKPVLVCGERGELDFGAEELKLRPDLFWDFSRLRNRLEEPGRVFMTVSRRRLPKLEALVGRKLHILASTRNTFLVSNDADPWPFPRYVPEQP